MQDLIPYEDWLDLAKELECGEQIHVNHTNCTAGADTKRRLYITRKEDNAHILLSYCHNCSLHGSYAETYGRANAHKNSIRKNDSSLRDGGRDETGSAGGNREADGEESASSSRQRRGQLPRDFNNKATTWGREHRIWVEKTGIDIVNEVNKYKLGASDANNSVILPVYRDNKLQGYQERTFTADKPKYVTSRVDKSIPLWWYSGDYDNLFPTERVNRIVIVEDILSGIKCARHTPTVALLGAQIGDDLTAFLLQRISEYGVFVIFLDDDNRQVRLNQLKIKFKLEQCGYKVKLITGVGKDPKCCSNSELKEILL